MGCCDSAPDKEQNRQVQNELDEAYGSDYKLRKLLLLGTGGSGKSTFFKQLIKIHGSGFEDKVRQSMRGQIYEQMIEAMKLMITRCEDYFDDDEKANAKFQLASELESSADKILATRGVNLDFLTEEIVTALRKLWESSAIMAAFEIRNEICVPDSTSYFFEKLEDEIASPDYIPSDEDLLMVRYRTTGMVERQFDINGHNFRVVDVGGQRNERRKWIHFFDNVSAVLFVAALSAYDEVVFEDEMQNSMEESIQVFDENLNSRWFTQTAFILFLNKMDLFKEKIARKPITDCFPDYTGPQTEEDSLAYIKEVYESKNSQTLREVYTHVTQATDTEAAKKVFNDVQHIVINVSLQNAGLIGGHGADSDEE